MDELTTPVAAGSLANGTASIPPAADVRPGVVDTVWIFHGEHAQFASGVFATQDQALRWIHEHALTGLLTEYSVGVGCYDLAVREGGFRPAKPYHGSASHVAGFSPSGPHVHVRDGAPDVPAQES